MTAVFVAAALLVVGGMAFAFGIARMAGRTMPKPPPQLVGPYEHTGPYAKPCLECVKAGLYEAPRVPPTTDERGLQ